MLEDFVNTRQVGTSGRAAASGLAPAPLGAVK